MEYVDSVKNNNTLWTTKYAPQTADQLEGLSDVVKYISKWLVNFEKNKSKTLNDMKNKKRKRKIKIVIDDADLEERDNEIDNLDNEIDTDYVPVFDKPEDNKGEHSTMVVIGAHGVGKTCTVDAILKSLNYEKITINFGKIKKSSDIRDTINSLTNNSNILTTMEGSQKKRNVLVIDEIESISSGSGKTCIQALLKNNIENWTCPIIFISDGQHSRLLTEMKKCSHVVKIPQPDKYNMLKLIKKIALHEKINIDGITRNDYTITNRIIEHAQKDYRRLILTMCDLKYAFDTNLITIEMFEEYQKLSKKKDEDYDLYRATNILLQKYNSIEDCIRMYETDKVVLPLMIQQNYLDCIKNKTSNIEKQFQIATKLSKLLSYGDVVENYIYGEQNWDIIEVHGYYTCVAPSYLLTTELPNEKYLQLGFATDLNKTSISKINKRNIVNANKAFKNKNINDYIYINMIIRYLTSTNRIKECTELLKDYEIGINSIESLMKVDKIKTTKSNLTSKQKKEISQYLGNID